MKLTTIGAFLLFATTHKVLAASTSLALRYENNGVYIHGSATSQTIENSFGTDLLGLPFTNSTTYDFYSLPLTSAVDLNPSDKGGGMIYMRNTSPSGANDFSVSGRMQYFDYNPSTGTETLIVDTTASPAKSVNHGQTVNWAIPNALLPATHTVPAGHLIHIAMTIGLLAGDPGSYGQVLYNGPSGASTEAYFPQNRSVILAWPLGSVAVGPPQILSIVANPDHTAQLNCSGSSGGTYLVQATANLLDPSSWLTISTNVVGTNGLFQFVDSDATNYPCRFYRASTP